MKKLWNGICVGLAFLCVGIGAVGIVLPILPTTPFLLLAAILFAKGSNRVHQWFLNTKLYQKHVDKLVRTRAMTKKAKLVTLLSISLLFSIGCMIAPIWHARALIFAVWILHFYFFLFRIRTVTVQEQELLTEAKEG